VSVAHPGRYLILAKPLVQQVSVDGKDVQRIIFDRLVPAIEGEDFKNSVLSMLTLAILMMKPNIAIEQLEQVVMGTSEYMVMAMADAPEEGAN
jgi:hypothetical protein